MKKGIKLDNQIGPPDETKSDRTTRSDRQIGPIQLDHQFGPPKETPITLDSRKILRPMSTRWKVYEVYFPTQQVSRHFDFPIRIYGRNIEDCSESQGSARGFILLKVPVQDCTILQCFMVHATHSSKAYQV